MIRHPFKKQDGGCSFICFLLLGLLVQIIYFFIYIDQAYLKDHTLTLDELALKRGVEDRSALSEDDPLIQTTGIVKNKYLWIPAIIFYFFSAMWLSSYLKLMFTDIAVKSTNTAKLNDGAIYCKKCKIVRRADIYHCFNCGVCSELHDHHCDVL